MTTQNMLALLQAAEAILAPQHIDKALDNQLMKDPYKMLIRVSHGEMRALRDAVKALREPQ